MPTDFTRPKSAHQKGSWWRESLGHFSGKFRVTYYSNIWPDLIQILKTSRQCVTASQFLPPLVEAHERNTMKYLQQLGRDDPLTMIPWQTKKERKPKGSKPSPGGGWWLLSICRLSESHVRGPWEGLMKNPAKVTASYDRMSLWTGSSDRWWSDQWVILTYLQPWKKLVV